MNYYNNYGDQPGNTYNDMYHRRYIMPEPPMANQFPEPTKEVPEQTTIEDESED